MGEYSVNLWRRGHADPRISSCHREDCDECQIVGSEVVGSDLAKEVDSHNGIYAKGYKEKKCTLVRRRSGIKPGDSAAIREHVRISVCNVMYLSPVGICS